MANPDQKTILIDNAFEEIKKEWISSRRIIPDLALVLSRFKFYNLTPLVDCQSLDPSY